MADITSTATAAIAGLLPSQGSTGSLPPTAILTVGAAIVVAFGLLWGPRALRTVFRIRGPYRARRILTPNETEFFKRLASALPGYVIFTQVSMSALIEPREIERNATYMRLRAKFAQKYVDYLICEPKSLRVVAIVELDDRTHDLEKDAARDEMLEGAGYTVVRWHSKHKPDRAEISRTIERLHAADEFPDP